MVNGASRERQLNKPSDQRTPCVTLGIIRRAALVDGAAKDTSEETIPEVRPARCFFQSVTIIHGVNRILPIQLAAPNAGPTSSSFDTTGAPYGLMNWVGHGPSTLAST